jgi:hypothetical protein
MLASACMLALSSSALAGSSKAWENTMREPRALLRECKISAVTPEEARPLERVQIQTT